MTRAEVASRILDRVRTPELQSQYLTGEVVEIGKVEQSVELERHGHVPSIKGMRHNLERVIESGGVVLSTSPTGGSTQPPANATVLTKDQMAVKLKYLKDNVKIELHTASYGVILTGTSTGLTAIASAGAAIFSNAAGLVTTLVAGGSGTTGVYAGTKDSISNYLWLRGDLFGRIKRVEGDLEICPEGNQTELAKIQDEINGIYDYLDQIKHSQGAQKN